MEIIIRKPTDDAERDWAGDGDRWFNERDYPDDYTGSMDEDYLVADVGGEKCVITIQSPGNPKALAMLREALLKR